MATTQGKLEPGKAEGTENPTPKDGGGGEEKSGTKTKRNFDKAEIKADKLRVRLTPIEEYEKKLVFHLTDAPGRIVTRLERLMGSDKVSLMDHDWMRELEDRLEAEDIKDWGKRNKQRMKVELKRYRKLAIDGLMPPTADMQDIYNHPIYRVNKIMNRLNKIDYNAMLHPKTKMPPLTLMDPFEEDESGMSFKYFPGHATDVFPSDNAEGGPIRQPIPRTRPSTPAPVKSFAKSIKSSKSVKAVQSVKSVQTLKSVRSTKSVQSMHPSLSSIPEETGSTASSTTSFKPLSAKERQNMESDEVMEQLKAVDEAYTSYTQSLTNLQRQYSIDESCNLKLWQPFQSKLLDVIDEMNEEAAETENAVAELYTLAEEVVGVYNREIIEAEETCVKLNRIVNAVVNNMSTTSQSTVQESGGPSAGGSSVSVNSTA